MNTPTTDLPDHPVQDGQVLDANLHLLDRTVLDVDDVPTSIVDDVDVDMDVEGAPVIASLVLGSSVVARFHRARPPRHTRFDVPWSRVASVGTAVCLNVPRSEVDVTWFESWLRRFVVARIPGGRRDPE
jgi:sporulation protein YlmC with PRC-barrel domain